MANTVEWFFGRGLSIGCGLKWVVPSEWSVLPRDIQIEKIKIALRSEMLAPQIDVSDIITLFNLLGEITAPPWRHRFHTTNWDYLLQRELSSLNFKVLPSWCANTHVYHLNGTVEVLCNNDNRSSFVLESDGSNARLNTLEGDKAFNNFIWSKTFVILGMSFECDVDKYLLRSIAKVSDDMPIGESTWIIINPDANALSKLESQLKVAIPGAKILTNQTTFRKWLQSTLPELIDHGVICI